MTDCDACCCPGVAPTCVAQRMASHIWPPRPYYSAEQPAMNLLLIPLSGSVGWRSVRKHRNSTSAETRGCLPFSYSRTQKRRFCENTSSTSMAATDADACEAIGHESGAVNPILSRPEVGRVLLGRIERCRKSENQRPNTESCRYERLGGCNCRYVGASYGSSEGAPVKRIASQNRSTAKTGIVHKFESIVLAFLHNACYF
jgi:hypothetical protein